MKVIDRCVGMVREKDRLYRCKSYLGEKRRAQGGEENLGEKVSPR